MKNNILFLCTLFVFFSATNLSAQKPVVVINENNNVISLPEKNILPLKVKYPAKLYSKIPSFVDYYHSLGYLAFAVDSVIEDSSAFHIYVFEGNLFRPAAIMVADVEKKLIDESNSYSYIKNGVLSLADYPALSEKIIDYYENNGFPFVEVYLDSITLSKDTVISWLVIDKHSYFTFDSIILKGDVKLSGSFLYPYLGLKKNKKYDESSFNKIPGKISELSFVTEVRPAGVEFVENSAYLYLYLNKVKVNQFDGYIGIIPVDETSGKVTVNGELSLSLKNIFTLGESFNLLWRSPERYSQYLDVKADFPYLLKTPFGLNFSFMLDKTDTSYMTMNYVLGLQYSFRGNNYLKAYFDYSSSTVISADLLVVDNENMDFADYKKTMYGVEFLYKKLDYLYNPRKGYSFLLNASAGNRKIVKNSKVDATLYDGIEMSALRYRVLSDMQGYIPLHKKWVLLLSAKGGAMLGSDNLVNELFKIGGFNTLRGFNENEIYASSYLIGLTELRFVYAKRSYINAFFNFAWYEKNITGNYLNDTPFGFGVGTAFDTKAGMFYLMYALGRQFDNPISLKSGIIHFGIKVNF